MKKKYKVLLSAYACEPNRGSEPGVGWNWVMQIARFHEVWVITRANNRQVIEKELAVNPLPNAHFIYYDLPAWLKWFKKGNRGVHWYYYFWQIGIYRLARQLNRRESFDIAQHVTFVNYWMPSFLALLPLKFIWGPVGGGDGTPKAFLKSLSLRGRIYERTRNVVTRLFEFDPFVRLAAHKAAVCLAVTPKTAERLGKIGASRVKLLSQVGLSSQEISILRQVKNGHVHPFRVVSIGNLLHLKGFHLGMAAFAKYLAAGGDGEYWLIGDGPEKKNLEKIALANGIEDKVKFWGKLPRQKVLTRLGESTVLLYPSLHDSGGVACAEAMGAGLPLICLNLGGPAMQVTPESGFAIEAISQAQVIEGLSDALLHLSREKKLLKDMGKAAQERVRSHFSWESKGDFINTLYNEVMETN